jgi:fatty acid desaturase
MNRPEEERQAEHQPKPAEWPDSEQQRSHRVSKNATAITANAAYLLGLCIVVIGLIVYWFWIR